MNKSEAAQKREEMFAQALKIADALKPRRTEGYASIFKRSYHEAIACGMSHAEAETLATLEASIAI